GDALEDLVAAHDGAERVGADADVVLAHGAALVHRVERGDARDLGGGQTQQVGAHLDALRGDAALDRLHEVQHRQERTARVGVPPHEFLEFGERGARVRGAHRSTPPMTGSIEATATMTSDSMPPSLMIDVACRLTKDGSRKCARYGRVPPSLTRWHAISPRGA